ncbi:UDP-N-acetylmuramate dehydrogenase [Pseudoduganella umbonata]|uniref:UDP-N-acetylenolpyruvoylglucosamine reductase n=1 Tax=Pseudoduganella umbonata TaxID=864828 RepID=A0A4P8HZR0_9BURK|nr:UDP-N-acetylmuramate dehydrogenase [Pseudoduganella umbonata]MBB3224196.1 UDP-N-acetylmuramate dehydrogenase [Pseudoduganella umbonata]QCP13945.1 UDP-N-acetylmuramate dehydrogenase [Pseudoduganella umbonata]
MPSEPTLQHDFSLRDLNTFGIDARARHYVRITAAHQLAALLGEPRLAALPRLVLGGGSNLLLTGDFDGLVLHMASSGREIVGASGEHVLVRAQAGENWHGFVEWTLAQGLGGLENLALIPGTVGAAPIQNIGAYGMETRDVFHSLTAFDPATGTLANLDGAACRFAYRDSLFKHAAGRGLIIVDVTFALPREWRPNLRYAELATELDNALASARTGEGVAEPTPRQVADAVIAIRRRKLPDPAVIGNAGSFFKNPVVSAQQCAALLERHPALVHHRQDDGSVKLAAGWLIDQCGWKGRNLGPAGVYPKQALVLVNNGGASGADVQRLAQAIQADVLDRYGVRLEPEPVFV